MKRILRILTLIFMSFLFIDNIKANSIASINMDIYVDSNGTAHITETWYATLNQGTEGYRRYGNLGNAKISNFKVIDGTREYTTINYWNTSASISDKAYKAGIKDLGSTIELCFGISSYGSHTYKLMYEIEGFITEINDAQIIYWELLPSELTELTKIVYIKIYSDTPFSNDLDVWGYGNYGGYAYVSDGVIKVSNDKLKNGEYITVLAKFDKGTFNTSNVIKKDFDYYYDMAEIGTEKYINSFKNFMLKILNIFKNIGKIIIGFIVEYGFSIFVFTMIIILIRNPKWRGSVWAGTQKLEFELTDKQLPKEINIFRDLPCNGDIYKAHFIAYIYNLNLNQIDFLGVILLKWIKQGKINIKNETIGKIFKRKKFKIIFNTGDRSLDTQVEADLYDYMYQASRDGILDSYEFERWCRQNYSILLTWFNKVLSYAKEQFVAEGKIIEIEKNTENSYNKYYQVQPSLTEDAIKMKGLKLFFKEFISIKDKNAIDVMLLDEYLMYAQILGLADKVAKQFEKIYPEIIGDYSYKNIKFISKISYNCVNSAYSAKISESNRGSSSSSSYSSGGGGRSSRSGGSGSSGSGGGGGFR